MKIVITLLISVFLISCNKKNDADIKSDKSTDKENIIIAFGSCNNQFLKNELWKEIEKNQPDIWIWGGDIIYADTENMKLMQSYYDRVKNTKEYQDFSKEITIIGTWDDHDFGVNDGGTEYKQKDSAQQLLLDFLNVAKDDKRRKRKGVYHSEIIKVDNKSIKILMLDTRYFRTKLTRNQGGIKRYAPDTTKNGTILGTEQWQWLENELRNSAADFNVIVSSIQFLSSEHGFETWENMPHEAQKLKDLIVNTKAKNVILLSGDRHIAEISKSNIKGLEYPLYDFTSSGLTHSYEALISEPNQYRVSKIIKDKNFGVLNLDLKNNKATMEIRGLQNKLYERIIQQY